MRIVDIEGVIGNECLLVPQVLDNLDLDLDRVIVGGGGGPGGAGGENMVSLIGYL